MDRSYFKYIFIAIIIIIVLVSIYIFSQNGGEEQKQAVDQTSTINTIQKDLRFAIAGLDTMNPLLSKNRNVQEISKIIFDPLISFDEHYKPDYRLAEKVEKKSDTEYIITVRKYVKWHNGTSFDANDVVYTINTIRNLDTASLYVENLRKVQEVKLIDDYNVQITLKERVPFFEYYLTFPIMSQKYYEGVDITNADKNVMPVGTGLFKFDTQNGSTYTLLRNDLYWDVERKPMAEQVIITTYGTIGEVYNSFKSGSIDLVTVNTSNVEEYIGTLGYNKIEYKARNYDFLCFNLLSDVFSDKNIRKAISYALDKNAIVATCLGNGYAASNFSLDFGNWLYTKDLTVGVDTEKTSQLLEEAGWIYRNNNWQRSTNRRTESLSFTLLVNSDFPERVTVAENIEEQLGNIGIDVQVVELNSARFNQAIQNNEFDCAILGIEVGFTPNLRTFFGDNNVANYNKEEVRTLLYQAENAKDEQTIYDCYGKLYDIYLDDCPYIGLYRNTQSVIMNTGLVGNISPNSFNNFHNIWQWYRQ